MPSRTELVEAAKDLNKVLDADPPIDVEKGVDEITKEILEAAGLLTESDKVEDNTRKVIDALQAPSEKAGKGKTVAKSKGTEKKTAAPKEKKSNGAGAGSKIRMPDADVSSIIKKAMPKDVREFSKKAADKMLKELRGRDNFSCSRERFHPLFQAVVEARA